MPAFPEVLVGDQLEHEALTVFPLFTQVNGSVDYLLSDEAIAAGLVTVAEVNEAGSVPTLVVTNQAPVPVLFLEGEELRGAKQNRVLNTSVLAAAGSMTQIPVSCVEQRRWRYESRHFTPTGSHSSSQLRHMLKRSVTHSVRAQRGHRSNQGEVWDEVERQSFAFGTPSPTAAMADTYEAQRARLCEFQERVKYAEGATGLAVAVGGRLVSLDLLDKPATCQKVWDRLLSGAVMDALEVGGSREPLAKARIEEALGLFQDPSWQAVPTVGAGQEFRHATDDDTHASALVLDDVVVHGSVVLAR